MMTLLQHDLHKRIYIFAEDRMLVSPVSQASILCLSPEPPGLLLNILCLQATAAALKCLQNLEAQDYPHAYL
jgi:hypothetical protein